MITHPQNHYKQYDFLTWANFITMIRTIGALALFSYSAYTHQAVANYLGLAVYWSLDMLDGYLARRLNQETLLGAQFDILSDRILIAFFYMNYLSTYHDRMILVVLFLFQFMVMDNFLSNQFMHWSILSPNYFYKVDWLTWFLNWSPFGKLYNTGLFTLLILTNQSAWLIIPVLLGLYTMKIVSFARLARLPNPSEQGLAHTWSNRPV